jgi:carboxyl-terminal processing protease
MRFLKRVPLLPALLIAVSVPALLLVAHAGNGSGIERVRAYAEILSLIEERHVPETSSKKTIYASIRGMLNTLDPHTNFLDDEMYKDMREEQRGHFYGLGIVISKRGRHQPLRIVAPISDTPAERLGIRSGDIITHIRDERAGVDIDTLGLTIQESVKHLRGPRGSTVHVTIDRPGLEEPLEFSIERDAIQTPAVNQAFMIRPGVAYIQISNFTETTVRDLDRAIADLSRQGARQLVLDLKNNPGGLLEQAVAMASRFLEPGDLVVYTEGRRPGSRQNYEAVGDVARIDWPMVVLVDRGSASASEIVAGALQDHDRALVVGETTFGKGLVQSVYPLSEGCGLALTTQKYYTPSGRSIQRPYESEAEYYFNSFSREAAPEPDEDTPMFETGLGRPVYGGGGITPDTIVPRPEAPPVVTRLTRVSAFSRFVDPLSDEERDALDADDDALFERFSSFVTGELEGFEASALIEVRQDVLDLLHGELALSHGGLQARDRILLMRDPVVLRGLEELEDASALLADRVAARETRASAAGSESVAASARR